MDLLTMMTYISLFSSAGIGCYGFKQAGFECIATNELIARRLEIQKANNKCKYDTGYICGDIANSENQQKLYDEILLWNKKENITSVDVIIATPPCQGMSVANHKKKENEILRNSLVIESIKIIQKVKPKVFIFENVPAFMKTLCTDVDGQNKTISEAIMHNLGPLYSYTSQIINFKNFGACSSRQRTLIIGVSNEFANEISPYDLFPDNQAEVTLRETIGHLPPLKQMGEINSEDIYHFFRVYPNHMREWIKDIKEGQSAFENEELHKKPHQIINGQLVINKQKNGDKYRRQFWDKVGPCVHTRNDQLASQNTIHPTDDRVFSIRELMKMMTIPDNFKWVSTDFSTLNSLSENEKKAFLKKEEIKIRQSLGEAVPTIIFESIANKIKKNIKNKCYNTSQLKKIIEQNNLVDVTSLCNFITTNPLSLSFSTLGRLAELSNTNRTDNAAYYTCKTLLTEIVKILPDFEKKNIKILEPSVGVGNFIPFLLHKYINKNVDLYVVDIDNHSLTILKILLNTLIIPHTFKIHFINADFLQYNFNDKFDLIIGNPPFYKMTNKDKNFLKIYKQGAINQETNNICSFFLDKSLLLGDNVIFILPKSIINTPEFAITRQYLANMAVQHILDFGEKGFPGVLVETIALAINKNISPKETHVFSLMKHIELNQKQSYIMDETFPYWIIYRNAFFDNISKKMIFNVFNVFRDRQITNNVISNFGEIFIIKSRNIKDDGQGIINIGGYDSYIDQITAQKYSVYEYLNRDDVFLTPNMTYKPRVIQKPKGVLVNGSVAILIPKKLSEKNNYKNSLLQLNTSRENNSFSITEKQRQYFSSQEYREFYQIARNYQTRSLNIDSNSVFFLGLLQEEKRK